MSADNVQKLPLSATLESFFNRKNDVATALEGKALPATVKEVDETGTIVTVNFEVTDPVVTFPEVRCALATTEWQRAPIKVGTKGMVTSSQAYMGEMTGLGDGVATLDQLPNLSNLIFIPCGNTEYQPTDNRLQHLIYGPDGVILRDEQSRCVFNLTPNGIIITLNGQQYMSFNGDGITLTYGGNTITLNASGINITATSGPVTVSGEGVDVAGGGPGTSVDGHLFLPHTHTGVVTGANDTGPVTP